MGPPRGQAGQVAGSPSLGSEEAWRKLQTEKHGLWLVFGSWEQMRFSGEAAREERPGKEEEPWGGWGRAVGGPRGIAGTREGRGPSRWCSLQQLGWGRFS